MTIDMELPCYKLARTEAGRLLLDSIYLGRRRCSTPRWGTRNGSIFSCPVICWRRLSCSLVAIAGYFHMIAACRNALLYGRARGTFKRSECGRIRVLPGMMLFHRILAGAHHPAAGLMLGS